MTNQPMPKKLNKLQKFWLYQNLSGEKMFDIMNNLRIELKKYHDNGKSIDGFVYDKRGNEDCPYRFFYEDDHLLYSMVYSVDKCHKYGISYCGSGAKEEFILVAGNINYTYDLEFIHSKPNEMTTDILSTLMYFKKITQYLKSIEKNHNDSEFNKEQDILYKVYKSE